ncbi:hypothetical protein BBD32_02670 [Elizabethkingia anophelis]|uniref:Uncharacterized protein n=3 Tax=Elizabethkingia TaxID=308865 RepID=A0AAU8UQD4_9FLAO|nr:hypothetical protein BBD32_02670 [Elizabethkingia anophelis]OPB66211.1 hypothetical protein BAY11_14700 [Elizabethkingia anophelis]
MRPNDPGVFKIKIMKNTFTNCDDFANYIFDKVLDFGEIITPDFNSLTCLNLPLGESVFELSELPNTGENYAQFGTVKSWFYDLYKSLLSTPANTYKELKAKVIARQSFVEVTEELYDEALEVLPPIWLENGCFMVDEAVTGDVYHVFGRKNGKFYGCLCNKGFALNNF